MSFHIDPPRIFAADDKLREILSYLTRTVSRINYAFSFLDVPEQAAGAEIRAEDPNNKAIFISEKSTNTQYPSAKAVYDYAVPQTRQINGKGLDADITLDAADVGAVPTDRQVNGHALETDVTLVPADLGEADFVTDKGANANGWHWRRWASGTVEMWGSEISVSLSAWNSYTTELQVGTGAVTYPITLADAASSFVSVTAATSGTVSYGVVAAVKKNTGGAGLRILRSSSASNMRFDIYVRGTEASAS